MSFDGLIELASIPFALALPDGSVDRANAAARQWFEATGLRAESTLFEWIIAEHHEHLRTVIEAALAGRVVPEPELRLRIDSDTARWVRLQCTPVPNPHGPQLLLAIIDVTRARSERERQLAVLARVRGVLDALPDAVFVVVGGRVTQANNATVTLLGPVTTTSLDGMDLRRLLVNVPPQLERLLASEPTTAGEGGVPMNLEIRRPDGRERFAQTLWLPMASYGPGAWLCVARDLTSQRELRAKLAQSERLASIGALASGVAHEINNPLQYVMEFVQQIADVLADARSDEDQLVLTAARATELGKMLDQVAEGTHRVARIVQDIKGQGRDEDRPRAVDLSDVVRRALELVGVQMRYDVRLIPRLGRVPPVWADPGRMMQVVLNLLINAAQTLHGRSGAVIEVDVERVGARVCMAVRDNGPGVSATVRGHLFEPFFTTKGEGEGSGLGLYLSRQYVREYGGEIELLSTEGEGACFRVWLPAYEGVRERDRPDSGPAQAAAAAQPRSVVLVVDDEASVRLALRAALRSRAVVIEASSAVAGIERIRQRNGRIDAILCDLQMPEGPGEQLHAWVLEHHPQLRAHLGFMTGGAFTPQTHRFLDEYDPPRLEKPFSRVVLTAFIDRLSSGSAEP